jgi:hypothetical protein
MKNLIKKTNKSGVLTFLPFWITDEHIRQGDMPA